jgi:hypothetical protein
MRSPTRIFPSLHDRLVKFATEGRTQAELHDPGPIRDALLEKVRRAEIAIAFDGWLASRELRAPI